MGTLKSQSASRRFPAIRPCPHPNLPLLPIESVLFRLKAVHAQNNRKMGIDGHIYQSDTLTDSFIFFFLIVCVCHFLDITINVPIYTLKNKSFFIGIYDTIKNLQHPWNLSIAQKVN